MKITLESEKSLLQFIEKLEECAEIIGSQSELLKRLSDRSSVWTRVRAVARKLDSLDGVLSTRK
jgi:hypothetical protein